ncbi:MAG: small subunit ribosomal protein [Solirubrobacteraceae bacterium]|nr:small subunit ribosomal protein [Solirubrobacteraceae bacterium]
MADEQDNETTDTPEQAPEQGADVQADAPEAADAQADAPEAADAQADVPEATDAGAEPADDASAPAADAAPSEPEQLLPPKERRRQARSTHSGDARAPRSPEERHTERVVERKRKAERRRARRLQERAKAAERRATAPPPEPLAPVHAPVEGRRRVRQGVVVSDKAAKTITVRIDFARRHRRYEKIVRSSTTLHAHDENNDAHEGDTVRVIESRPLSRSKRWALVDVLERAR